MILFPSGGKTSLQIARNFEDLVLHFRCSFWGVLLMKENNGGHQVARFISASQLTLSMIKLELSSST